MQQFEWNDLQPIDPEKLTQTREQLHQAVQNVAAVGRKFLPKSRYDEQATLVWVPGLYRMAGKWVKGDQSFRSSISIETFTIYLVDEKVNTLASFSLEGQTHRQVMIWLEEQIGKLGLKAANLTMNLPYELPPYPTQQGEPFHIEYPSAALELGNYYHNAFICMREIRQELGKEEETINIWPHHFDQALEILIKDSGDPETDTKINFGMSPGDAHFPNPYFYVSSWPNADTSRLGKLDNNAFWVSDDWTGAVLLSKHLLEGDQHEILLRFYRQASDELVRMLTI